MPPQVWTDIGETIGEIPYRMAFAGGWIDQPFVSRLNPRPPGSIVVVALEPTFRWMERSGMATGTRKAAMKLWNGRLPSGDPADLVRSLYADENRGKAEPSGSQDMIGLIYPGVNRLDFDFACEGGVFPAHIESNNDPAVARWLEKVIHVLPVEPRPQGYNPLGVKNLEPGVDRPAGAVGQGLLRRDPRPRRQGPGRRDERVHGVLGGPAAAHRATPDDQRRSRGPAALLSVEVAPGRCIPAAAAATFTSSPRNPSPARSASPSASPRRVERVETLVVSGSFDDLRSAHVRLLQEAARGGPVHVLLWSDAAIERLEGRRPKFPQDERRYLVESIRYVDRVTICPCSFGPEPPPSWAMPPTTWIIDPFGRPADQAAYCRKHGLRTGTIEKEDLAGFPDDLPEAVDSPKARKRVIVSGCFDWFHSGHVRFFEEASALGDLYVVVGHDANIRLLKGEGHPLFPQEERRYLAQAVRFVTRALVATRRRLAGRRAGDRAASTGHLRGERGRRPPGEA